jgi:U3 small nucleolar RNA-associated protein 20
VQALFATCLGEATPYLPATVRHLLRTGKLRALEPRLIEKTFSVLSEILRQVAATLLKPEADGILRATWAEITPLLRPRENKRYVRQCVADAWVAIIRKARGESLKRLIAIMLEERHQGMEAVWAHSIKGAPKQLHSRAIPILDTLLDDLRDDPSGEKDDTMKLVITSICHHCASATLVPVVQNLLDRLDTSAQVYPLLSTLLFIRKGKRYPESLLKPTMQKLVDLEISGAYLRVAIAALMASKLEQWLSPGVVLIEKIWKGLVSSPSSELIQSYKRAFEFADALVRLKWPGAEQFLLPHIAK